MNLLGRVIGGFPRVTLSLVNQHGANAPVTFIVDTGFEGEIALPYETLRSFYTFTPEIRRIQPVNSAERESTYVRALLVAGNGENRVLEVLVLDHGDPLIGVELLWDHRVSIEMASEGEVTVEEL